MTHCTTKSLSDVSIDAGDWLPTLKQRGLRWLREQRLKATLRRERSQLLAMTDTELADIGIDRETAAEEAARKDIPTQRIER